MLCCPKLSIKPTSRLCSLPALKYKCFSLNPTVSDVIFTGFGLKLNA